MGSCGGHQGAPGTLGIPSQTFDARDAAPAPSHETAAVTIFFHMAKSVAVAMDVVVAAYQLGSSAHHQPSWRRSCWAPVHFMTLPFTDKESVAHHYFSSRRPGLAQQLLRPPLLSCWAYRHET